jgi:hypothetical protein
MADETDPWAQLLAQLDRDLASLAHVARVYEPFDSAIEARRIAGKIEGVKLARDRVVAVMKENDR